MHTKLYICVFLFSTFKYGRIYLKMSKLSKIFSHIAPREATNWLNLKQMEQQPLLCNTQKLQMVRYAMLYQYNWLVCNIHFPCLNWTGNNVTTFRSIYLGFDHHSSFNKDIWKETIQQNILTQRTLEDGNWIYFQNIALFI